MKEMLKICGGLIVLFLGFYVMYLGSANDSNLLFILGIIISIIGSGIIYVYRHRHSMKLIYTYRKAIDDLSKDPDNQELIDNAYKAGKDFYRTRSDGNMLGAKEKKILDMDIAYARGKKVN